MSLTENMIDPTEKKRYRLQRRLGTFSGHSLGTFQTPKLQSHLMKSIPTHPTRSPEHICPLNLRCLNKPSPHWMFRLQLVHQLLRDRDTITTLHGGPAYRYLSIFSLWYLLLPEIILFICYLYFFVTSAAPMPTKCFIHSK